MLLIFILVLHACFYLSLCNAMFSSDVMNYSSSAIVPSKAEYLFNESDLQRFKVKYLELLEKLNSQGLQEIVPNNVHIIKNENNAYKAEKDINITHVKNINNHQLLKRFNLYYNLQFNLEAIKNKPRNDQYAKLQGKNLNKKINLYQVVEMVNTLLNKCDFDLDKHILQPIYYTNNNQKTVKNEEGFYLYRSGLIPYNCDDIKKNTENYLPGQLVLSNGPVNNRYIKYTKKNDRLFSYMLSLRNAFNYEAEACSYLLLLKYFYEVGSPIKNISTICYGWQSLVFALHALTSDDEKATNIRKNLGIDRYLANALLSDLHYIEIMNPMLAISPLLEQCWRAPFINSTLFEPDQRIYKNIFSCSKKVINYALDFGIRTFFYGGVQYISSMEPYNANSMMLLYNIKRKNYLNHINLLMHWEQYDKLVKPPSVEHITHLSEIFNFYGVGASSGTHRHYNESKNLYINYIRKNLHVPYYEYERSQSGEDLWQSISQLEKYRENKQWEDLKNYSESESDEDLWQSISQLEQYRENKQWEDLKNYSESVF